MATGDNFAQRYINLSACPGFDDWIPAFARMTGGETVLLFRHSQLDWKSNRIACMTKGGYTYLLASGRNGTLYVGVTSQIDKRWLQHQNHSGQSFTGKYQVNRLVWLEWHDSINEAIAHEKQLKKWNRAWKIALIQKGNPN